MNLLLSNPVEFSLSHMEKFMLTNKKLHSFQNFEKRVLYNKDEIKAPAPVFKEKEKEKEKEKPILNFVKEKHIVFPQQKDSLFWCFYILKHGIDAYQELGSVNIVVERKMKIEYVEKLRENKKTIRSYKTAPLVAIENFLVNEPTIDMATFFSLCILEKIHVIYVKKKTYFELKFLEEDENTDTDTDTNTTSISGAILYEYSDPLRYGCCYEKEGALVQQIKTSFYPREQMNKPVRAYSAYKANDLIEICNKLDINTMTAAGKKRPNKELYEAIVQYF